ncbi:hypothetical protein RUM44_008391 [Polyplax serrata]|uniref:Uncharacterized protein n=1 Tax=Polyplax serrata TaxID=468196 RepID=A0ABR1BCB2_POLSC
MFHGNLTWGFGVGSNREAILKIEKESNDEVQENRKVTYDPECLLTTKKVPYLYLSKFSYQDEAYSPKRLSTKFELFLGGIAITYKSSMCLWISQDLLYQELGLSPKSFKGRCASSVRGEK